MKVWFDHEMVHHMAKRQSEIAKQNSHAMKKYFNRLLHALIKSEVRLATAAAGMASRELGEPPAIAEEPDGDP